MSRQPLAQVHPAQQPSFSQMQSVPDTQQQLSQATLEKQPADQEQQPPALPAVIHKRGKKKVDAPIPGPPYKRGKTNKQTGATAQQAACASEAIKIIEAEAKKPRSRNWSLAENLHVGCPLSLLFLYFWLLHSIFLADVCCAVQMMKA